MRNRYLLRYPENNVRGGGTTIRTLRNMTTSVRVQMPKLHGVARAFSRSLSVSLVLSTAMVIFIVAIVPYRHTRRCEKQKERNKNNICATKNCIAQTDNLRAEFVTPRAE
jgi:hypothetical protein